jgi:hypothetical protein
MLEVSWRPNPDMMIKIEGRDLKDVFKALGPVQEVLGHNKCGKCGGTKIRMVHRNADGHDFYELMCENCSAKLSLGQSTDGKLFPRRYEQDEKDPKKPKTDNEGKVVYLPDGGWVKWDFKQKKNV